MEDKPIQTNNKDNITKNKRRLLLTLVMSESYVIWLVFSDQGNNKVQIKEKIMLFAP